MKRNIFRRGAGYACRTVRDCLRYSQDFLRGTYANKTLGEPRLLMSALPNAMLQPHKKALTALAGLTLEHRFDLLGSGWVELTRRLEPVNFSNRRQACKVRAMIDAVYQPIDWQCDFKSGYRWSERTWHRHIRFGEQPGVDVKVPWELSRMQHLPRLALANALEPNAAYTREFRNQVLDFGSSNPPRFGVNWVCAMDVAIRAANWLVAYDLFSAHGARFDSQFIEVFTNLITDHGRFVRAHLERRGRSRNNHYLAGIAGLVFIAAYLPGTKETEAWLRFATGELIREVRHQFHADGSNFEGSTSYHRLSGEMVYFATAILLGLPAPPAFPPWFCKRLAKIAAFTEALRMPDGSVPQIGDNDSGRFFHFTPMFDQLSAGEARRKYVHLRRYDAQPDLEDYWDQNDLDHSPLVDAAAGLFRPDIPRTLEGAVIRSMSRNRTLSVESLSTEESCKRGEGEMHPAEWYRHEVCRLEIGESTVRLQAFPDFGVYVYSSDRFFLSFRCGGTRGAHAHDDHLSIELHHDGHALFRDPGTYVYTPHPALRRRYRSLAAHAVPYHLEHRDSAPVFQAAEVGWSQCRVAAPSRFVGYGEFGGQRCAFREVQISHGTLEIIDFLSTPTSSEETEAMPFSPGYGKLVDEWIRGGRSRVEEVATCVC